MGPRVGIRLTSEGCCGSAWAMGFNQIAALVVLVAVVGVLIHGKVRSDVAALTAAATLLVLGVIRPHGPSSHRFPQQARIDLALTLERDGSQFAEQYDAPFSLVRSLFSFCVEASIARRFLH